MVRLVAFWSLSLLLGGCQLIATNQTPHTSHAVEPLLALSAVHVEAGRLTQALPLILRAQDLAPDALAPKLALADLLAKQGDDPAARARYSEIWQDSTQAAHHYGQFLHGVGETELALIALDRAEADVLYKNRLDVLRLRARIRQSLGDFDLAYADLAKARRMAGDDPRIVVELIRLQIVRGDYADALALYRDLEALGGDDSMWAAVTLEIDTLKARLAIMQPRFGS